MNNPTFPRIITQIITILEIVERSAVIPVDNPTVPNAETTSNNNFIKGIWGSAMVIINVAIPIENIPKTNINMALFT